jgi:hypothetical protein
MFEQGKVHTMGHRSIVRLFDGPVQVEEKVDGSFLAFGKVDGEVEIRSRSSVVVPGVQKMFDAAVAVIHERASRLEEGVVYRGEYLSKPRHNALTYGRVPENHIAIFDVRMPDGEHLPHEERGAVAADLGFEAVPVLYFGEVGSVSELDAHLDNDSFLGGPKIEGVVVKNYAYLKENGVAPLMGKYVSPKFREAMGLRPRKNVAKDSLPETMAARFCTPARWQKAVQHLTERGELKGDTSDIGQLLREVQVDIEAECADEIREALYQAVRKDMLRAAVSGFAQWYKDQLAQQQFEGAE